MKFSLFKKAQHGEYSGPSSIMIYDKVMAQDIFSFCRIIYGKEKASSW